MIVKDLVEALLKVDQKLPVATYSDDEGNRVANLYPPSLKWLIVGKDDETPEYFKVDDIITQDDLDEYESKEDYISQNYGEVAGEKYELREIVML